MTKNYIIDSESGINFYEELYKSLDEDSPQENENDLCLITNSPLIENFVQLDCKHKFNYLPLYNDILMHKKMFNKLESEIRCPYCRNVQTTLLPYHQINGVKLVHGVNYFDAASETGAKTVIDSYYSTGTCCYVTKSYCVENGIKVETCTPCSGTHVIKLELDGKTYCSFHKYYAIKDHQKTEKMKAVQKAKDEKKKANEHAKLLKKQTKEKEKQDAKLAAKQNVVIDANSCTEIIKSGPKKGTMCGCKAKQNNKCGRHFKLQEISTQENSIQEETV